MKCFPVLFAAAALLGPVQATRAEPPQLPPPVTAKPGEVVRFSVPSLDGQDLGFVAAWADVNAAQVDELRPTPGQRRFLFVGTKAGVYPLVFWSKGEAAGATLFVTVAAGGKPDPRPDPDVIVNPDNDPPKPPPQEPSRLFVVVVDETEALSKDRGRLLNDKALAARFAEKGHTLRSVDKDVVGPDGKPPADVSRFLSRANGKPYPQVFLVDEKGKTRVQADLPADPAKLLDLIKQAGG